MKNSFKLSRENVLTVNHRRGNIRREKVRRRAGARAGGDGRVGDRAGGGRRAGARAGVEGSRVGARAGGGGSRAGAQFNIYDYPILIFYLILFLVCNVLRSKQNKRKFHLLIFGRIFSRFLPCQNKTFQFSQTRKEKG